MPRALVTVRPALLCAAALLGGFAPRTARAQQALRPSVSWIAAEWRPALSPDSASRADERWTHPLATDTDPTIRVIEQPLSLRHHLIVGGLVGLVIGGGIAIGDYQSNHCRCADNWDGLVAMSQVIAGTGLGMESGALVYLGRRVQRHYSRKPAPRVPNEK